MAFQNIFNTYRYSTILYIVKKCSENKANKKQKVNVWFARALAYVQTQKG